MLHALHEGCLHLKSLLGFIICLGYLVVGFLELATTSHKGDNPYNEQHYRHKGGGNENTCMLKLLTGEFVFEDIYLVLLRLTLIIYTKVLYARVVLLVV